MTKFPIGHYAAIDPMAVILPDSVYYIWTLIHHPHVPAVDDLERLVERMSAEEKAFTFERARAIVAFGKAVEEVVGPQK